LVFAEALAAPRTDCAEVVWTDDAIAPLHVERADDEESDRDADEDDVSHYSTSGSLAPGQASVDRRAAVGITGVVVRRGASLTSEFHVLFTARSGIFTTCCRGPPTSPQLVWRVESVDIRRTRRVERWTRPAVAPARRQNPGVWMSCAGAVKVPDTW